MAEFDNQIEGNFRVTGKIESMGEIQAPNISRLGSAVRVLEEQAAVITSNMAKAIREAADDSYLTSTEKRALQSSWEEVKTEYPILRQGAIDDGINPSGAEIAALDSGYTALRSYLLVDPGILSSFEGQEIIQSEFLAAWNGYFDPRSVILNSRFETKVSQYWEQRYKRSATAPSAPTPADPVDWFVAIPSGTDPIWVTGVLKNADGTLAGTWADPRQINTTSQWYAYHDNAPTSAPATPTGDGMSGGWHANETSASVWVSVKTSVLRGDAGTWSTPAVRPGITLLPTYSPKYIGPGRLSATGTAAFRKDTINADGSVTTGSNITPNPGDWMYNYDTSLVATLSVFRWSGTAWETGTVTWEHWIAATEDIGRYIKGGTTEAIRTARTPASWTFLDTLFASEAFIDRLAARLIRSANYNAGVAGMSIDLNSAIMQAENGKWKIDGTTGKIYAYDLVAYGIDLEVVDGGSYSAIPAEAFYGVDGLLDGGTYVAGSYEPDGTIDGGYFMGG